LSPKDKTAMAWDGNPAVRFEGVMQDQINQINERLPG
jgi:hypothetical protein